jgi:hypothetical protein
MIRTVPYQGIGNPIAIIAAGASLPFEFDRGDEDVTGWACDISVVETAGDTPLLTRSIALDANRKWSGSLTSTETTALTAPATYRLVANITNAATDEKETAVTRFRVTDSWV